MKWLFTRYENHETKYDGEEFCCVVAATVRVTENNPQLAHARSKERVSVPAHGCRYKHVVAQVCQAISLHGIVKTSDGTDS